MVLGEEPARQPGDERESELVVLDVGEQRPELLQLAVGGLVLFGTEHDHLLMRPGVADGFHQNDLVPAADCPTVP